MTTSREQWARFEMSAAFPANSTLAGWIAGITMIANDLIHSNVILVNAMDSQDAAISSDSIYYFWLSCAQYREAADFLRESSRIPEVSSFVGQLSPDAHQRLTEITASFTPWDGSIVNTVMRPLRNKLFHYPKPDSQVWRKALEGVAAQRSGVRIIGEEKIGNVRAVFADEIRAQLLGDYLGTNDHAQLRETIAQISKLVSCLVAFAHEALTTYLLQLPPGVVTAEEGAPSTGI
jgi:hypothetical protein